MASAARRSAGQMVALSRGDRCVARISHQVQPQPGKGEVAEVVGAGPHLEAVAGGPLRGVQHTGLVDEQVDADESGHRAETLCH
jgi:hypothetical protein